MPYKKDVNILNYIDGILGYDMPNIAKEFFDTFLNIRRHLNLTGSTKKKIIPPTTRGICLAIVVDTVENTLSIHSDKLKYVKIWLSNGRQKVFALSVNSSPS